MSRPTVWVFMIVVALVVSVTCPRRHRPRERSSDPRRQAVCAAGARVASLGGAVSTIPSTSMQSRLKSDQRLERAARLSALPRSAKT